MSTIIIIMYALSIAFIKLCNAQIADCRLMFISDTNPGIFYEMYPLNLNGVPIGVNKADISTYLSRLSFYMPYMFADNVPGLNFDVPVTVGDNEVVEGQIYGKPVTVSNFSFSASAWLRVPKTGWYIFDMKADSGAELLIVNYTTVYCCKNPSNTNFDMQFKITSIPSEPTIEHPTDRVYLYKDFPYELLFSYINLNSSAYLDIHVTDPDGVVHTDLTDFTSQMNQRNDTEIVTCNYLIEQSRSTEYWTGTVTSTLTTSRKYTIASNGTVLVTDVEVVAVPNPVLTQESSISVIESKSTFHMNTSFASTDSVEYTSNLGVSTKTGVPGDQNSTAHSTSENPSFLSVTATMSSIMSNSSNQSLGDTSTVLASRTIETDMTTTESYSDISNEQSSETLDLGESRSKWSSQSTHVGDSTLSSVAHTSDINRSSNSQSFSNSVISSNVFFSTLYPSESPVYNNLTIADSSTLEYDTLTVLEEALATSTIDEESPYKQGLSKTKSYPSSLKQYVSSSINPMITSITLNQITVINVSPAFPTGSLTFVGATCTVPLSVENIIFTSTNAGISTSQSEDGGILRAENKATNTKLPNIEPIDRSVGSSSAISPNSIIPVINPNAAAFTDWNFVGSSLLTLLSILFLF